MAGDILTLGYVWNDALGWVRNCTCHPDEAPVPCQQHFAYSECVKALEATEHLHRIGNITVTKVTRKNKLFSVTDQIVLRCQICGAERKDLNSPMRWPNDIHGDPGTATAEVEADEFGAITSRTRWLTPGSSTDYR